MLQIMIIGNLGADAHVEESNGRKFVSMSVAHTEKWNDAAGNPVERVQWVSCAMDGDGGALLPHLKKGRQVFIIGHGSTRVYSSPKTRRFEAGLNISVIRLELIGGQADEIPSRLYSEDGVEHRIYKAFYVTEAEAKDLGAKKDAPGTLMGRDGRLYDVQKAGWVTPRVVEEQPQQET